MLRHCVSYIALPLILFSAPGAQTFAQSAVTNKPKVYTVTLEVFNDCSCSLSIPSNANTMSFPTHIAGYGVALPSMGAMAVTFKAAGSPMSEGLCGDANVVVKDPVDDTKPGSPEARNLS